jgi:peptidoglycan/xylan/chitin deacetylase (PgdA/CDA1 family)
MHQLPILLYHRIIACNNEKGKDKIYVTTKAFDKQLHYLKENKFECITFRDIYENRVTDFTKKIILTFDDGYEDNYRNAFPLLKKYGYKAVIFKVTQQTKNNWKKHPLEPEYMLLTENQMKEMDAYGIEFGGHTQNHPDLTGINTRNIHEEISGCKHDLENLLQKPCLSFSYPYGATNEHIAGIVKNCSFKYAVTTNKGVNSINYNPFLLKRISVSPKTTLFSFKNKTFVGQIKKKNIFTLLFTQKNRI